MSSYTQPSPKGKSLRRAAPSDGAKQYPKKTVSPGGGRKGAKNKMTSEGRLSSMNDFIDQRLDNQGFRQLSIFDS